MPPSGTVASQLLSLAVASSSALVDAGQPVGVRVAYANPLGTATVGDGPNESDVPGGSGPSCVHLGT